MVCSGVFDNNAHQIVAVDGDVPGKVLVRGEDYEKGVYLKEAHCTHCKSERVNVMCFKTEVTPLRPCSIPLVYKLLALIC